MPCSLVFIRSLCYNFSVQKIKEKLAERDNIMELFVLILIIIGCILCHKLSTSYNERMEEKYCQGCINWWMSVITAVLLAATILTIGEEYFLICLISTIISSIISAFITYRRMSVWKATSDEIVLGCLAQIASSVGVAAAIVFIILLLFGGSDNKRKRRSR